MSIDNLRFKGLSKTLLEADEFVAECARMSFLVEVTK